VRTVYLGREPDGSGFWGYVEDSGHDATCMEEGGPWATVEEGIQWARSRADRVVLTYGWTDDARFSAGPEHVSGLPEWPPDDARVREIDEAVAREAATTHVSDPRKLGVVEPEIRP
jgi:hypothetical protein